MKIKGLESVLALIAGGFALNANATIINILDIGDSGTTADGTIFSAEPNPTSPSTGTGVFEPFLRIGAGNGALCCEQTTGDGLQLGFNTDEGNPDINFDTKNGSNWTRAVLFSELGVIDGYYVLSLDANQLGSPTSLENQIVITDLQIYLGSDPNLAEPESTGLGYLGSGYTGTIFDSSDNEFLGYLAPSWSLDSSANGDVDVVLQASICDSKGQCGSGHGDLDVFIPKALLSGSVDDYFLLYTEYSGANDGFEEWRFNSANVTPPPPVPEPTTLSLLGMGLILIGSAATARKRSTGNKTD